jgi:hypothetical protein
MSRNPRQQRREVGVCLPVPEKIRQLEAEGWSVELAEDGRRDRGEADLLILFLVLDRARVCGPG